MKLLQTPHYLIFLFLLISTVTYSQKNTLSQLSTFRAMTVTGPIEGYFHHIDSTGLYFSQSAMDLRDASTLRHVPLRKINALGLRKKGAAGKGILIGSLTGMAAGFICGQLIGGQKTQRRVAKFEFYNRTYSWTYSTTTGVKRGVFIVPGAIVGGILGGSLGGLRKQFILGGKKNNLQRQENKLKKYTYNL